jgi:hypothetical protein
MKALYMASKSKGDVEKMRDLGEKFIKKSWRILFKIWRKRSSYNKRRRNTKGNSYIWTCCKRIKRKGLFKDSFSSTRSFIISILNFVLRCQNWLKMSPIIRNKEVKI